MRSESRHPVLDYFRVLDTRARSRHVRRRLQSATQLPLTQADNAVLLLIDSGAPSTVSQLASAAGVSVARASRQVTRLTELDLVHKAAVPGDGRATRVTLTDSGRRAREQWRLDWVADYARVLDSLSTSGAEALASDIRRLHRSLAAEGGFGGVNAGPTVDSGDGLQALTAFAQWAGPTISHPAYSRAIIDRIGAPLSPQSLFLLRAISAYGPIDISDLAEHTSIDSSSVSRHSSSLADDGLIVRLTNPADARGTLVRSSSAGLHVLLVAEAVELEPIARALRGWPPAELSRCLDGLSALSSGLSPTSHSPATPN